VQVLAEAGSRAGETAFRWSEPGLEVDPVPAHQFHVGRAARRRPLNSSGLSSVTCWRTSKSTPAALN